MTLKKFINKLLTRSCIYFTCIMVIYIIIAAIINVNDDTLLLEAGRTVLFFVFSLLLAFANSIFALPKLSTALKIIIHYITLLFAFYACFMLPTIKRASGILIGLVIFSIVYFVIMGIIAAFKSRFRHNLEKSEAYQKQYKK